MTLQQLEYFVSAAHNLNFSKTAEMFFVSQSAITQQIRSLEKELKLDLFVRKNNRISLTDSGQVFMREAEQILAKVSDSIERVHSVQRGHVADRVYQMYGDGKFSKKCTKFLFQISGCWH